MRSGSAADTQVVATFVKYHLHQHRMELASGGMDVQEPTVQAAASLVKLIVYQNRANLTAGLIVAGIDKSKGSQIYQVVEGTIFDRDIALAGSGSVWISSLADRLYEPNMSKEQAIQLAQTLVTHAIHRDGSSGGICRWTVIDEVDGTTEGCLGVHNLPILESKCAI